jgi:hypothetical protein
MVLCNECGVRGKKMDLTVFLKCVVGGDGGWLQVRVLLLQLDFLVHHGGTMVARVLRLIKATSFLCFFYRVVGLNKDYIENQV